MAKQADYDYIKRRNFHIRGYETVVPQANYAPWQCDSSFQDCYSAIQHHTLVDIYRCYELWQLIEEIKHLDGALIEVGVWQGGTAALIAQKSRLEGIHEMIYACDTFSGVVKAGDKDTRYRGGEHADTSVETVEELMRGMNLDNVKILQGIFPEETAEFAESSKFRFCHVDVDVYQSAKDIVEWIWPRLVQGGILVFDDYGFSSCDGVTKFVNEERQKKDRIIIHNLNGHAIMVKL